MCSALTTPFGLTRRELEVAELVIEGRSNKTIAYVLGISETTVKVHIYKGLRKAKARGRSQYAVLVDRMLRNENPVQSPRKASDDRRLWAWAERSANGHSSYEGPTCRCPFAGHTVAGRSAGSRQGRKVPYE